MIPQFSYQSIVLSPADLRYNPCHDIIFPCVIKAADFVSQPLGAYYLYYAPHDAPGGICLAYADSIEGPWIEYDSNPIIHRQWAPHYDVSHVSSPHVLWMEAEAKLFLYFHGENDTTRIASSSDGIHFEYEGVAITTALFDQISESSYARVFPCTLPSQQPGYVMLFMGNNQETRRIYAAWSRDGRTFTPQREPLINPPPGTGVTQVGAPWYLSIDGRNLVVFHGDKTECSLRNIMTDLYIADVGPTFTDENHLGLFYPRQDVANDNDRVSDPCFFQDGAQMWLFLSIGSRLKQSLALARNISS